MKILFLSAYFPPEVGAPAHRAYELPRRWAAAGHSVQVLTGFPNHPTGTVPPPYRQAMRRGILKERMAGLTVVRTWLYPAPNRKPWQRILNYGSFGLSAGLAAPWLDRPDVVVATSPHLLTGLAGWWASRCFRVPFILEIRDLWPQSLLASGVGESDSLPIRFLHKLARFLYCRADRIVAVTEPIAQRVRLDGKLSPAKAAVVEHGVEGAVFRPLPPSAWPPELEELSRGPVISYIGTIGLAHGLTTLLEAAERIGREQPNARFLLVGEGADKSRLMDEAVRRRLDNVRFLPLSPWDQMPALINRSALCVALLKRDATFQTVLPTKLLEYLACGKAVVLAADGHARKVLEESGGGIAVDPEDALGLADAILTLLRDPDRRRLCGENGRRYVLARFDLDAQAHSYLKLIQETLSSCRTRTS